jgi:hypothetical protein
MRTQVYTCLCPLVTLGIPGGILGQRLRAGNHVGEALVMSSSSQTYRPLICNLSQATLTSLALFSKVMFWRSRLLKLLLKEHSRIENSEEITERMGQNCYAVRPFPNLLRVICALTCLSVNLARYVAVQKCVSRQYLLLPKTKPIRVHTLHFLKNVGIYTFHQNTVGLADCKLAAFVEVTESLSYVKSSCVYQCISQCKRHIDGHLTADWTCITKSLRLSFKNVTTSAGGFAVVQNKSSSSVKVIATGGSSAMWEGLAANGSMCEVW